MAKRPTHKKKIARLRKALRQTPTAYIDLTRWLQDRGYAQTGGAARQLMTDGKVRVGSHAVGREKQLVRPPTSFVDNLRGTKSDGKPVEKWVAAPFIHAGLRGDLRVDD